MCINARMIAGGAFEQGGNLSPKYGAAVQCLEYALMPVINNNNVKNRRQAVSDETHQSINYLH